MISINTNQHEMIAAIAGVSTRALNKAFSHSANATMNSARTFVLRALTEQGMKRKIIAPRLSVFRSNPNTLLARLYDDSGRKIPLAAFSPRSKVVRTAMGKRVGVTVEVNGVRALIPGAFLVQLKSGRVGIFKRVGSERLPITEMMSKSLADIYNATQGLPEATQSFVQEKFRANFIRDFDYYKAQEA